MWAPWDVYPQKVVLAFVDVPVVRLAVRAAEGPWVESVCRHTQGCQDSGYNWGFFDHQCPAIRVRSRKILIECQNRQEEEPAAGSER